MLALHRPIERIPIPPAFHELLTSRATYKTWYGGRGAAKSQTFGSALVYLAPRLQLRILCAREIQASIADSVHALLRDTIDVYGYGPYFRITDNKITCPGTGSEFIFKGLRHNIQEVRSTHNINIAWVEEGQNISDTSWELLIPTVVRSGGGSQIWISMNPDDPEGATQKRFIDTQPDDAITRKVSWRDNPFFPDKLDAARRYLQRVDPEAYQHVWEGHCRTHSEAQILKGKVTVEAFTPGADWTDPMHGADWGFAVDPTVLVKCWIHGNKLFIEHEAWALGCELNDIPRLFDTVPGARKATIFADCSRPETISHVRQLGFGGICSVEKWAGSVEDGVSFLRQFEQIIIHPRCVHTATEARLYRYKIDERKGKERRVTTDIVDADNHCMDAIRYALHQKIRTLGMGVFNYYAEEAQRAAAQKDELNGNGARN